jgi:hypothetical protein
VSRTKGARDKKLRANASPATREAWEKREQETAKEQGNEFLLPGEAGEPANELRARIMNEPPANPVAEPEPEDLVLALRALRNDSEFIAAIVNRAKTGKLSASESKAILGLMAEPEKPRTEEPWQRMLAVATEPELVLMADLLRRAQPERMTVRGDINRGRLTP